MSGGFSVKCTPINAWREKGYRDGEAGRPRKGPLGLEEMAAYVEGYRHGVRAAERSRSAGELLFEWQPHLYATTDPDPDGRVFVQWLPLHRDATPGEHAMLAELLRRNLVQRVSKWPM